VKKRTSLNQKGDKNAAAVDKNSTSASASTAVSAAASAADVSAASTAVLPAVGSGSSQGQEAAGQVEKKVNTLF
jgi:hypothetical protein